MLLFFLIKKQACSYPFNVSSLHSFPIASWARFAHFFSSNVFGPSLAISVISMPFDRSIFSSSSVLSRFQREILLRVSETFAPLYLFILDPRGMETYSTTPMLVLYATLCVVLSIPRRIGSRIFLIVDSSTSPRTKNFIRKSITSPDQIFPHLGSVNKHIHTRAS